MMRWTSIIIGAICAISSCGEFRNIGLLDDMLIVPDNDAAEAVCAETESLTLALPVSFEWRLSRPVGVWLVGESSSGETLVWSASNLPPGIGLTDEAGVLAGAPSASGTYTSTLTATSSTCPGLSESRAIRIDVTVPCIDEDCGPSPECGALRHEAAALEVEYVSARGGRRGVSGGETLALDGLLVETVLLNSANASAQRTLVLAVPNSKDTVLVHYTLPGGVYAPVTGQRIDLRYLHGDYDDQYLFLTIDHLKRFSLVHRGVLTRDELQRRCPGNPIGLHCRLPEIDWVPLECSHPRGSSSQALALETVTAADEGPSVIRRRIGPGKGLVTGGMLLMLVDAVGCSDLTCDSAPVPVRSTFYEIPNECAVCRIDTVGTDSLTAPVEGLVLRGEVLHPRNVTGAEFTWTAEAPVPTGVLTSTPEDGGVVLRLPMVGEHTVRLGCTAQSRKANLKSCGPAEMRFLVGQRQDRPVRAEFWYVAPSDESGLVEPPQLRFNGDNAQLQGPRFQVVEPSSFGELTLEYSDTNAIVLQAWVRVLVDGHETTVWSDSLVPGQSVTFGSLGADGLQELAP